MDSLILKAKPLEKNHRSIAKSISYRILSLCADSTVAYFFTHDIALSATIVIFVNAYSTILYYLHERVWAHIHWGHQIVSPPISSQSAQEKS